MKIESLLVFLFAASLLISQSLMDAFSALVCLAALWQIFKRSREGDLSLRKYSVGFDWIWLPFAIAVVLSFLFSDSSFDQALAVLAELKWIFTLYALVVLLERSDDLERAFRPYLWVLGVCCLYALAIPFLGFDPLRGQNTLQVIPGGVRTGGFLGQAIVFAHSYSFPLTILWGLLILSLRWNQKILLPTLVVFILNSLAILFSFTRGVWLALAAALTTSAFIYRKSLGIAIVATGVVLVAGLYFLWPDFQNRIHYGLQGGDQERVWIWRANLAMWNDSPIFGVGYGQNTDLLPAYYKQVGAPENLLVSHAHNQYLNVLAGAGIIGLLGYLLFQGYFLILSLKTYLKIPEREYFEKGLLLGCVTAHISFLLGGLTESNYEHSKIKYCLALVWALVVVFAKKYNVIRERI
jgi:O-antigen ligase